MNYKRRQDEIKEKNMQPFLDDLYVKNGFEVRRVHDRETQLKGIDVYLKKGDVILRVDEKAATSKPHYYDKLNTYSFELSSLNNPNALGWLLNDSLENNYLNVIYAKSESMLFNDISDMEILILDKESIKQRAFEHGLTSVTEAEDILFDDITHSENFEIYGNEIKFKKENGDKVRILLDDKGDIQRVNHYYQDGSSLVMSLNLKEQPINYLLPRNELREMAVERIEYHSNEKVREIEDEIEL